MADRVHLGNDGFVDQNLVFEDDFVYTVETLPGEHVQAVLDHCQRVSNHRTILPTRALGRPAATIDMVTRQKWRREWERGYADKMKWGQFLVMKLNSSENSRLRTGVSKL